MNVNNPDIRIALDLATLEKIKKQANSDVDIIATTSDRTKLSDKVKAAIGNRPVFDLKVKYNHDKLVQNFDKGSVTVAIPYTLEANENPNNVYAVYIDDNGNMQWLLNSVYDIKEKSLRFTTNHFSTYGVGYKQENAAFADIANHWAKDDITFVVSRGLFSGTTSTTFNPNTAPDQPITREQMAVIMQNYAKALGYTIKKSNEEKTFADISVVDSWAGSAVKEMHTAGIINGRGGNKFDPKGTATRAEVSVVLHHFVQLIISAK